jgi:hypothetical protein
MTAGLGVLIVSVLALMRTPALSGLLAAQDLGPRMMRSHEWLSTRIA